MIRQLISFALQSAILISAVAGTLAAAERDFVRELQTAAIKADQASWGHWGPNRLKYTGWKTHSNRLIPVYTFGTRRAGKAIDLDDYTGTHSAYRNAQALERIYGHLPADTLNPQADYMDQTDLAGIQRAAL